ncbi:MAG: TolC family outer membrane protein [Burkholderiales bacterium]
MFVLRPASKRPNAPAPKTSWKPSALFLALGLAASGVAQAQNLLQLYEAARQYDATYLAAKALADSARYKAAQSDALFRPTATLVGSSTRSESEFPSGVNRGSTTNATSLQGRQPLFNKTSRVTIDQAQRTLELSKWDLETAEQDLIVRVAQAYFDVLASQDALETTRTNKVAIAEQLASAKRNFEVGTQTITDTREAQAKFDLATAQEIAAENDLRVKRIALDQLVGRSSVQPNPLVTPVALPATTPNSVDAWVSQAAMHPAVQRAQLAADIATLETEKARAGHLPTLDAVATAGVNKFIGVTGPTSTPGTTQTATLGLQFNWPLYSGLSVQNRIKETLVLEEKTRNDLEAAKRSTAQATRSAYFGVESGRAQVAALEAAESSSKLALEATQLGYRVGVRVNLDVLNAQTQLFTTRRDLAKARYEVVLNGLKLRQAAGQLKPADVEAANRLLTP